MVSEAEFVVDLTNEEAAGPGCAAAPFNCALCAQVLPLAALYPLSGCSCVICQECLQRQAAAHLQRQTALLSGGAGTPTGRIERSAPCPGGCRSGVVRPSDLQILAPDEWARFADSAFLHTMASTGESVRCPYPSCGAWIEKLPPSASGASASRGQPAEKDAFGDPLTPAAAAHKQQHRYLCAMCKRDFCGSCLATPYHLGCDCQQAKAPDCLYCGRKLLQPAPDTAELAACRLVELRRRVTAAGADRSWCLEKADLQGVLERCVARVCERPDCRARLGEACTRELPCGHPCGGIARETACLPCLEPGCAGRPAGRAGAEAEAAAEAGGSSAERERAEADASTPGDCMFCWEPLTRGPCLQLRCRHVYHLHCVRAALRGGYPGPEISFKFMFCPLCGPGTGPGAAAAAQASPSGAGTSAGQAAGLSSPRGGAAAAVRPAAAAALMDHPAVAADLAPWLALWDTVSGKARAQLRREKDLKAADALQPDGAYDGRPVEFALSKMMFYNCARCKQVYYGGLRQCGGGAAQAGADGAIAPPPPMGADGRPAWKADELVCGGCSAELSGVAASCPRHGGTAIEWRCKFCCSTATWFCFGNTHFCDPCHRQVVNTRKLPAVKPCPGASCALATPHPTPGSECCLGCALCKNPAA